jgi:hypothetical protein
VPSPPVKRQPVEEKVVWVKGWGMNNESRRFGRGADRRRQHNEWEVVAKTLQIAGRLVPAGDHPLLITDYSLLTIHHRS